MFERVEAVLFDLDGTLVDSVPDLAVAVDRMLAQLGLPRRSSRKGDDITDEPGTVSALG